MAESNQLRCRRLSQKLRDVRDLDLAWRRGYQRDRSRVLALLFAISGVLMLVAPARPEDSPLWMVYSLVLGGLGITIGVLLFVKHARVAWVWLQVATSWYAVMIGVVVCSAPRPVGVLSLGPALIALVLIVAYFGTRRELLGQTVLGSASFVGGALFSAAEDTIMGVVNTVLVAMVAGPLIAQLTNQLRRAGAYDQLTGLLNRATWLLMAERQLERVHARPDQTSMHVALIDLDHFKMVNDVHGHLAGDALLAELAEAWRNQVTDVASLGRFGGDEFVVLFRDCTDAQVAELVRAMRDAHEAAWSVGVVRAQPDSTMRDLLAGADAALLAAKHARGPAGVRGLVAIPDDPEPRPLHHRTA